MKASKDTQLLIASLQPLIKEIKKIAKFYYTMDSGTVFLNPHTMNLWISASDCGYNYSKKPLKKLQELFREELWELNPGDDFVDFDEHPSLYFLNKVEWEAESDPESEDYVEICKISDLDI